MMIEFPSLTTIIQKCQKKPMKAATMGVCAIPALEMTLRLIGNAYQVYYLHNKEEEHELATNFIGVVFLTSCLMEFFPGGRVVGAVSYIFYAAFNIENNVSRERNKTFSSRIVVYVKSCIKARPILSVSLLVAAYFFSGKTAAKTSAIFSRVWQNVKF